MLLYNACYETQSFCFFLLTLCHLLIVFSPCSADCFSKLWKGIHFPFILSLLLTQFCFLAVRYFAKFPRGIFSMFDAQVISLIFAGFVSLHNDVILKWTIGPTKNTIWIWNWLAQRSGLFTETTRAITICYEHNFCSLFKSACEYGRLAKRSLMSVFSLPISWTQ